MKKGIPFSISRIFENLMRIAENIAKKVEKNIYLIYNSILKP